MRNCFNQTPEQFGCYFSWGPDVKECPRSFFADDELWFYLSVYQDWRTFKMTPWGNPLDAPGPIWQALRMLETSAREVEGETLQKHQREAEKRQQAMAQSTGVKRGR